MNFVLYRYRRLTMMLPYICYFKSFSKLGKKYSLNPLSSKSNFKFRKANQDLMYNFIFAFSFIQFLEATGLKKQSELKRTLNRAKELLQDGNKNEALDLYKTALPMAIEEGDKDIIFTIKEKIAIIAFSSQQYPEAEILFLAAKEILVENGGTVDDIRMLYINLRLAETYDVLRNTTKAEEHYKLCSKGVKLKSKDSSKSNEFHEFRLMFLVSRAHYSLSRGYIDSAHKYFTQAYELSHHIHGGVNEQTVILLQQLGSVTYQKGDLEAAVARLKEAIQLGKHLPGMIELANAYISLGNIYLVQGLFKAAESECSQGLKNAQRHNYEPGIKEATNCLEQVKMYSKF